MAALHPAVGERASLSAYLSRALRREWKWGDLDCFLFCADWIVERDGVDPAAEFRAAYHDVRAARRLMKVHGGIAALADRCLVGVGLRKIDVPSAGDVGLVTVFHRKIGRRLVFVPVGAICLGPKLWVIKTAVRGEMVARNFPLIQAWGRVDA